jgi:hypothetical protein
VAALVLFTFVAQAAAMAFDEVAFHRRRGLPRWERIGHPLDTLTVLACFGWLLLVRPSPSHAVVYGVLVLVSSMFVTKDEPIHARVCTPGEHWLHAVLFVLHPVVLLGAGWLWWTGTLRSVLVAQLALAASFALYQLLYWNLLWRPAR